MSKDSYEKERAQKYLDIAGVIFLVINSEQKVTLINKKGGEVLGCTEEEILGKNWFDNFLPERVRENEREVFKNIITGNIEPFEYAEGLVLTKTGEERIIAWHNTVLTNDSEKIIETLSSGEDITEHKKAEQELMEAKEFLENVFSTTADGIMISNSKGYVARINRALEKMLGYSKEEIIGKHTAELFPRDEHHMEIGVKMITELHEKGRIENFEACFLRKDGSQYPIELNITMLKDREGKNAGAVSVIRDVTERKRMEEEIRSLSLVDELTQLYNRRGFITLADQQLKIANRLQASMLLIFADLDGMKWINDNLGHYVGDQALKESAMIFKDAFRKSDIVARVGGDEFVILALGTTDTTSDTFINRIQEQVKALNAQKDRLYKLSISTGIAYYYPYAPCSVDELLVKADKSMYKHKQDKRGFSV